MSPDEIRARLLSLSPEPPDRPNFLEVSHKFETLAPAAVLVALTERKGELEVVLTKRATTLRAHPGEVSFPGGRMDATDRDLQFTALREAHEEIALRPDDVTMYGALMRMPTITGFEVTMYVGEFDQPYHLDPNPDEIDTLLHAPLTYFERDNGTVRDVDWGGRTFQMYSFDVDGHNVWGATAFMLVELIDFLNQTPEGTRAKTTTPEGKGTT